MPKSRRKPRNGARQLEAERATAFRPIEPHEVAQLQELGNRLESLRQEQGLSRFELARRAGLSSAQVRRLELATRRPSADSLRRIAEALGTDVEPLSRLAEGVLGRAAELESLD